MRHGVEDDARAGGTKERVVFSVTVCFALIWLVVVLG